MKFQLTGFADVQILREGTKLVRRIGQADPIKTSLSTETWPGSQVQSDQQWETWMRGNVFTEFHPSSTCAMLPLELGGVVDANLRVYGLANVRVADASVPPMAFSAHLMSSTYGLAEQASNIIRSHYNGVKPKTLNPEPESSNGGTTDSNDHSSGSSNTKSNSGSRGLSLHPCTWVAATMVLVSYSLLQA